MTVPRVRLVEGSPTPTPSSIMAVDNEHAVIGSCLMEPNAVAVIRSVGLLPGDFADARAGLVLGAILRVDALGAVVDPNLVADNLEVHDELIAAGGKEFIGHVIDTGFLAGNIEYYARIVERNAKCRALASLLQGDASRLLMGVGDPAAVALRLQPALAAIIDSAGVGHRRLLTDVELATLPEPSPLIEGLFYKGQLVAVVGKFGTFKTFLLLDWALCIALGLDWHGRRVHQGHVVYVAAEGASGLRKRVAAWKAFNRYDDTVPIHFLPSRLDVCDPADVALLIREIRALKVTLGAVFIDTVARNMSGDENSGEAMKLFIAGCDRIKVATGATVVLAHHTGWGDAKRSRGSTELPGALDTEIVLERDDTLVTLTNTKQKDAAEFAPITLEASTIRESLVLTPLVPHRAELTRNERHALTVVQGAAGLSSTEWMELSKLAKGSYDNARRRLMTLAYVRVAKSKYFATDAGILALGTKDNVRTTEVQPSVPERYNGIQGSLDPVPCTSGGRSE